MLRHGLSSVSQGGVQRSSDLTDGNRTIDFLTIDEQGWCSIYAQTIRFFHGRFHGILVLCFDA